MVPDDASPREVAQHVASAAAVLRAGGTVVLPTDTVYGLAALPEHVDRLAHLKGRPAEMPVAVLVADLDQARALVVEPFPAAALRMARAHWPGPLTMVLPARDADAPTVGVRWPRHELVVALAAEVGPLATTSANRHGQATPATAAEAAASLVEPVDLVIDGGVLDAPPSSVVDLTAEPPVVLREGALSPEVLFGEG